MKYNLALMVKSALYSLLYHTKILDGMKHIRLKDRAFILMYHRVFDPKEPLDYYVQPGMYVTKETFELHMEYLKNNFKVIALDKLIDKIKNNEKLTGYCSITFDDGWVDNYKNAFPILKKYDLPATIFLATGFIGTNKWFWPEEISFYLRKIIDGDIELNSLPSALKDIIQNQKLSEFEDINTVIEKFKLISPAKRHSVIECMNLCFPVKDKKRLLMDWAEVKEMHNSGLISFGAHTVNHEILTQLETEEIEDEILLSKKHIEKELGDRVNLFAYPNGNSNKKVVEVLLKNSFKGSVVTQKGYVESKTNTMEIPRIGIHDDMSKCTAFFLRRLI